MIKPTKPARAFTGLYASNVFRFVSVLLASLFFSSCSRDDEEEMVQGPNVDFFVLTADNRLQLINGQNTTAILRSVAISGLPGGETILGIDFRPNTGQLFGVSSGSRLYVINTQSGAATAVGTAAFTPAISGTPLAFDFNPTVDRIRLVTSGGQNLRINPETGAVAATDGNINGAAGAMVTAAAYTQSRAGATATVLYDIDVANNKLYRQDPPNNGTLVEVGSLNVDAEGAGGFDISSDSANALAVLTVGGKSRLYSINLSSGNATPGGDFADAIIGLAIPTAPAAYAVSSANALLVLNPNTGELSFTKPITALQPGENIVGIDMRPATGQLFALGSSSRLYTINISTGAAVQVGTGALTTSLAGTEFGFDFNPTVDRIRVVSNTGQNLRLNPNDGTVTAVDGTINPATSVVTAAAYTNNFAGATTTVLFDLDAQADRLLRQDPPNNGTVVDLGPLGINIEAANGFDISGSGIAYGLFTVGGATRFYSVNLANGTATQGPAFSQGVRGFALGIGL